MMGKYFVLVVITFLLSGFQRSSNTIATSKAPYYLKVTTDGQTYTFNDQSDPPTLSHVNGWRGHKGISYTSFLEIEAAGQPPLMISIKSFQTPFEKPDTVSIIEARMVSSQSAVYSRNYSQGSAGQLTIDKIDKQAVEGSFYINLYSNQSKVSRVEGQFRAKYISVPVSH